MSARARGLAAPAVATLIGLAILIGLGVWQLKRLAWKEALIAAVEARVSAPAVGHAGPAEWPALDPATYEYRHVRATGVYDLAHQALVFRSLSNPRGRYSGPGYLVMTPLKLASGESVLVNRGFVPEDRKSSAETGPRGSSGHRPHARERKPNLVHALRRSRARTMVHPRRRAPCQGAGARGPCAILDRCRREREPGALPQGGETILAFPNNHLSYAITWFGTALALAGVFIAYAIAQMREKPPRKQTFAGAGDGDGGS